MAIIYSIISVVLGLLSGFIFHKLAESKYWIRARFILNVPTILAASKGRIFAHVAALVLLLGALLLSRYWWLSGVIFVIQITSWKSGEQAAKDAEIEMMTRRCMEKDGLSESDAKEKAIEIVNTMASVRGRNIR